jgi:hypothetical protein
MGVEGDFGFDAVWDWMRWDWIACLVVELDAIKRVGELAYLYMSYRSSERVCDIWAMRVESFTVFFTSPYTGKGVTLSSSVVPSRLCPS